MQKRNNNRPVLQISDVIKVLQLKNTLDYTPENKLVNQGFKNMEWNWVLKNRS